MKTIDSDNEYNNFNLHNGVEETTDLLINGKSDNLLQCNADLAKSFNVLKSTPMGHKGRFYQRVLLKNNVTNDSRSRSLPNSLDEKNKTSSDIETVECCDIESKLLPDGDSPPVSPVQDLWFKTWPERYDKLKTSDTDTLNSEASSSNSNISNVTCSTPKSPVICKDIRKVTLNEAKNIKDKTLYYTYEEGIMNRWKEYFEDLLEEQERHENRYGTKEDKQSMSTIDQQYKEYNTIQIRKIKLENELGHDKLVS